MTPDTHAGLKMVSAPMWLEPHRKTFLERLGAQGYASATIRQYEQTIDRFCREVEGRDVTAGLLDGAAIHTVQEAVFGATCQSARTHAKYCLVQFIEHLVDAGAANLPAFPAKEPTVRDCLREEYDAYLRHQRGMSEATIYHCMRFLERFITFRFGAALGNLNDITPDA